MKCDLCDNKATVFCSTIVDDKMQKVNLCKRCAEERGVMDPTSFALADLLFGLGKQEPMAPTAARTTTADTCPACGLTAEQLRKTGRVGCAKCYEVFSEGLGSIIKAMHKGQRHVGKAPARLAARRERAERHRTLQRALDEAIRDERYEDAARIRDELAGLDTAPAAPPAPATRA